MLPGIRRRVFFVIIAKICSLIWREHCVQYFLCIFASLMYKHSFLWMCAFLFVYFANNIWSYEFCILINDSDRGNIGIVLIKEAMPLTTCHMFGVFNKFLISLLLLQEGILSWMTGKHFYNLLLIHFYICHLVHSSCSG